MKKPSGTSQSCAFYLFVTSIYLIIVCKDLFSNGMFLDGLIYSTVSKNLANGTGSFWNPHFTATCLPDFHEHPPLAFGIQSIFFTLFGENRFVDKFYSLITVVIAGFIILKIWKTLGYKNGWFPLLLWIITPTVFWASYNNLLENTLTIFTTLSILLYLKNQENKKNYFMYLSGFVLALGFLTKGFVAFFPWTFPFIMWLFLRKKSFGQMAADSTIILASTLIPLLLLILLFPVAKLSLHKYIDNQVINSLKNVITVSTRFDILKRLFFELTPEIILIALFFIVGKIKKMPVIIINENTKKALIFIFLGLTGVLPIMISMKQSGFYILPVYPLFALASAILMYPFIDSFINKMNYESKGFLVFKWCASSLFLAGIVMSVYFSGQFSRDKDKITDTKTIITEIPGGSIININPGMADDWSLHAYYARFKNISLDPDLGNKREFLIIRNEYYSDTLNSNYNVVKLNTKDYQLYRKNKR